MSEHRPIISSARLIAVCTLASRVTGLVRDMLLVHAFGAAWVLDAFFYAFQFPNLFRRLFGEGALSAVFVPVFARTLENEGRPSAWQLLARTLALLCLVLLLLIMAIEAVLLAIWLLLPGGADRALILALTALMLPFMLTICVVALFSSILNCLGSFGAPALAPVVLNLVMMAGIVWLGPLVGGQDAERQMFGVAFSVLLAGALQLGLLVPVLWSKGVTLGWSLRTRDPRVREMLGKMVPVLFGQGVLLVGTFLDAQICALLTHVRDGPQTVNVLGLAVTYPLTEGALTALTVAQRLYQFPLGVLAISLATAALPAFSRLAARSAWHDWSGEVTRALRLAVFEGLLAGAFMIALAEPIVQLLFEHGRFDPAATPRAARVLAFYGFGMWAFCAHQIVLRGFYSVGDVSTPVKISCVLVPVNLVLSLVLIWFDAIREAAFAISTSTTSTLAVLAGMVLLRRRVRTRLADGPTLWALARMVAAAAASALLTVWLRDAWAAVLADAVTPAVLRRALDTLGALGLGCALFLGLAAALGLPEARLLLRGGRGSMARPPA